MLAASIAIRRAESVGAKPQRRGQRRELRGNVGAKRPQRRLRPQAVAHRRNLGDAPGEPPGKQANDEHQDVVSQPHPAPHPAHRARKGDGVGAKRVRRRHQARGALGPCHHRLELVERAGQPGRQTVRQQAERGVTLGAVPASDTGPARGLARVGAVAGERTPALRVVRTARETCIAPRPGSNPTSAIRTGFQPISSDFDRRASCKGLV